ncbi:MAG: chloramphenicol phosphotransferase CPT family protein [Defluviitaleaceae bacterium]|nr:chloramphenicol phosphotransferase CPT family protein [Defluviitaleaceae bacterium]
MTKGKIIFFNGVSSAGKTTLANEILENIHERFWWLSHDLFCDVCSKRFWKEDWNEAHCQALMMMIQNIKLFSDSGKNVVVDAVFLTSYKYDLYKNLQDTLRGYPLTMVQVTCPLDELRRREKERGDRKIGQAESQLTDLNPQDGYDLVVDTHKQTAAECAEAVLKFANII